MAVYLVQHGKSLTKTEDPGKGLSVDGQRETKHIAGVAKEYQVGVSRIVHSGKKRARETAEILAGELYTARFYIASQMPYLYQPSEFPGNYLSWLGYLNS